MYYAYVLRSVYCKRLYKGSCEDLNKRLAEHNAGKTTSTKPFVPWEVVYFEVFDNRDDALNREKYFKTAAGRRLLKKII
jgi:putative endonuclease